MSSPYSAAVTADGNEIRLSYHSSQQLDQTFELTAAAFSITVNGTVYAPSAVSYDGTLNTIHINLPAAVTAWDDVRLTVGPERIKFKNGFWNQIIPGVTVYTGRMVDMNHDGKVQIRDIVPFLRARKAEDLTTVRLQRILQLIDYITTIDIP